MRRCIPPWQLRHLSRRQLRFAQKPYSTAALPDIQAFQEQAFKPQKPFHFSHHAGSPTTSLPATHKWFVPGENAADTASLSSYTKSFSDWPFPYELVAATPLIGDTDHDGSSLVKFRDWLLASSVISNQVLAGILHPAIEELGQRNFFHIYAPLQLLVMALEFNRKEAADVASSIQLYVAQSSLADLPVQLREDLPTPDLVLSAGRGDVYNSSIWLGSEPTYTPLHRDPNPNLFCQLCSSKVVRLLPPKLGDQLFLEVQARLQQHANSRIRTTSMMEGKERQELHAAVWEPDSAKDGILDVELSEGDALFIPKGWWHSIKSKESKGQLNASVNWWFR